MLTEPDVGQIFDRVWRMTDEAWAAGKYIYAYRLAYETDDGHVTWGRKQENQSFAPSVELFKQHWANKVELIQYSVKTPPEPEPEKTLIDKIVEAADWYLSPDEDEAQYTAFRVKLSTLLADEVYAVSGADTSSHWDDLSTEPPAGVNVLVEVYADSNDTRVTAAYLVRLPNGQWTWSSEPVVHHSDIASGHAFREEALSSSALRTGMTRLKIVRD